MVRKARGKSLEQSQCQQVQAQWRAFESAFRRGQARAIGVSNYCVSTLQCLLSSAAVVPAVLQGMHHLGMGPDPYGMVRWLSSLGIVFVAYR